MNFDMQALLGSHRYSMFKYIYTEHQKKLPQDLKAISFVHSDWPFICTFMSGLPLACPCIMQINKEFHLKMFIFSLFLVKT